MEKSHMSLPKRYSCNTPFLTPGPALSARSYAALGIYLLGYRLAIFSEDGMEKSGRKKAHKHKLFALVNVQMALGQTAGCPRVNRAKKFMCSPRNTGNINFSLWLAGGLFQGCPDFQKVYVFKVDVPFFALKKRNPLEKGLLERVFSKGCMPCNLSKFRVPQEGVW